MINFVLNINCKIADMVKKSQIVYKVANISAIYVKKLHFLSTSAYYLVLVALSCQL